MLQVELFRRQEQRLRRYQIDIRGHIMHCFGIADIESGISRMPSISKLFVIYCFVIFLFLFFF